MIFGGLRPPSFLGLAQLIPVMRVRGGGVSLRGHDRV